jgi:hypothetical protein
MSRTFALTPPSEILAELKATVDDLPDGLRERILLEITSVFEELSQCQEECISQLAS